MLFRSFQWKSIPHIPSLIRLWLFLRKYKKNYEKFRTISEKQSQKRAIEEVPYFYEVYTTPAEFYIKKLGCEYWARHFMNYTHWATAFCDIGVSTGAQVGMTSLPFIVPTHEFIFDMSKLTQGMENRIVTGTVSSITREEIGRAHV